MKCFEALYWNAMWSENQLGNLKHFLVKQGCCFVACSTTVLFLQASVSLDSEPLLPALPPAVTYCCLSAVLLNKAVHENGNSRKFISWPVTKQQGDDHALL